MAKPHSPTQEARWVQGMAIAVALLFLAVILFLPLCVIFAEVFLAGIQVFYEAVSDPDTLSSIRLTLLVAAIVVPLNTIFGVMAAWAITKYQFRGKVFLITLIDVPFSISPVIAGLAMVLVFGPESWLGPWLADHHIRILFAVPAVVLATLFVTFPFVARELIPLMQDQGTGDEEAALSLGASGLKTFFHVTLPNIKWGLLYGVLLCNARAMGEFGAVWIVSGRLPGETVTLPLQIEIVYNTNYVAALAIASLLTSLALVTLVLKTLIEKVYSRPHTQVAH